MVSATASPNYTLTEELFEDVRVERPMILIDLAVPRDIDPEIRKKDNITLYDMDSFRTGETPKELADNLEAAGAIVKAQMNEFFQWLEGRDIIPRIQEIKADAVEDLNLRIEKNLPENSYGGFRQRKPEKSSGYCSRKGCEQADLRASGQSEPGCFSGMCGRTGETL